jgi:hypothetical protein
MANEKKEGTLASASFLVADGPTAFPMTDVALPSIGAPFASSAGNSAVKVPAPKEKQDDQTIAVKALVKTLNATVTKLFFSFSALNAASTESSTGSIDLALKAAKREELSAMICDAMTTTVERIVRCDKAAIRSSVLRDIRARFSPPEKPKPLMVDCGVQAEVRPKKTSKAAAAVAAAEKAKDDVILKQLAAAPAPAVADASSTCFITAPVSARANRVAATMTTAEATAGAPATTASGAEAVAGAPDKETAPRPVSAVTAVTAGIFERQMQWAAKAAANREKLRLEKENREREAEAAPAKVVKASKQWAHVESVMKRERVKAEETWKSDLKEQMEGERERRDQAESKLLEERAKAEALAIAKAKAEEQRAAADARAAEAHQRAVEMELRYKEQKEQVDAQAKMHSETLEIRDAFGDKGLEVWPMFPGKKLFRVLESEMFDGRVSAEFRVKDAETGERGVTLLMGRVAHAKVSEAQAILFDTKLMSDLDAARWWTANAHRFEKVKERVHAMVQRAQSASTGSARGRGISSAAAEPELTPEQRRAEEEQRRAAEEAARKRTELLALQTLDLGDASKAARYDLRVCKS